MSDDDVGYYLVEMTASYNNTFGKRTEFKTQFIQIVLPRPPRLIQPEPVIKPEDKVIYIEEWYEGMVFEAEPDPYDPTLP